MTAEIRSINKYDKVNWVTVVAMSIFHVGAVAAFILHPERQSRSAQR